MQYTSLDFDIEQEITKNYTVEETTFYILGGENFKLEKWKKLFDALPNIKRVRVVEWQSSDIDNLPEFIKILSVFKNLESLHFAIERIELNKFLTFDVPKIKHLLRIIKDNFPIKAKVVIADMDTETETFTNVIEKEEGKLPKIVKKGNRARARRYPLSGSPFLPKQM